MKKILTFALLAGLVLPLAAADWDWGGKIENTSQYAGAGDDGDFIQGNRAALWLRGNVSPLVNLYAQGAYVFSYENEEAGHAPDLSDFYLYGKYDLGDARAITYNAGRFNLSDRGGRVMNTQADGLELSFLNRTIPVRVGAAYAGLVFDESSDAVISPADNTARDDDDYLLGPKRLLEIAEFKYPNLMPGHTLTMAAAMQQDVRPDDDEYMGDDKTKVNSQYYRAAMDGPLGTDLYYVANGTLYMGQAESTDGDITSLGGMGYITLDYYFEKEYSTVFSLELSYTTGDSWEDLAAGDTLSTFSPISPGSKGFVYGASPGNLMYADLGASVKPVDTVQLMLNAISFFRAVDGPVSGISADGGDDSLFLGEEIDFVVNYRPFSDFGAALTAGVFIPSDLQPADDLQYKVGGYFSMSF